MGILTVALWHMDEAAGLQYIAGFGGRNDVAARCVSYIPTASLQQQFVCFSTQAYPEDCIICINDRCLRCFYCVSGVAYHVTGLSCYALVLQRT